MIRRLLILTALLAWGTGYSALICAGDPIAPPAPIAPPVALTPPQQQRLTALHTASHAQSEQLYDQLRQTTDQLHQLYATYSFDAREARRLNLIINHIQSQLLDLRLSEQQQLRDILSADQFAQIEASMRQHGPWDDPDGHGHRPGHGMFGGGG